MSIGEHLEYIITLIKAYLILMYNNLLSLFVLNIKIYMHLYTYRTWKFLLKAAFKIAHKV